MSAQGHPPFDTVIEEAQYRMRGVDSSPAAKGGSYIGWGLLAVADAIDRLAQAVDRLGPPQPPEPKPGPPDHDGRPRRHE